MICTFCGKEMEKGTGIVYAKKDGTTYYFCSSKCKKNQLAKKYKPLKTRWTETYQLEKKRHMKKQAEKSEK
ncbi:MAG: 50S ribosomal protein L24e [Candidatus ainarchaeum sp.]|nr:50S ribosomal protein L24e [Candidatus ainarchaeum sp.]